eukprot:NODE_570_length_6597_cov_0.382271.p5 type:complete len:117 gc:universal NODE_570_length_6597_cov_0.382271:3393-3043(-)
MEKQFKEYLNLTPTLMNYKTNYLHYVRLHWNIDLNKFYFTCKLLDYTFSEFHFWLQLIACTIRLMFKFAKRLLYHSQDINNFFGTAASCFNEIVFFSRGTPNVKTRHSQNFYSSDI